MNEYEYGIQRRLKGTDDEWEIITGYRKTTDAYRTAGPAKAFKSALENGAGWWNLGRSQAYEYKLVKRKISPWEDV